MQITVVVVTYNTAHLLDRFFTSLRKAARGLQLHCVVIDNASRDDSADMARRDSPSHLVLQNSVNVGFGRANNQALSFLKGSYVLLINPDAFVSPDTLEKTIAYMGAHPRCGILGVRLVDQHGVLQPSCRYAPTPLNLFAERTGLQWLFPGLRMVDDMRWAHDAVRECDWVPGCFYLVRKQLIDEIGLFDPRFFLYYEEVDHCLAAKRAGWQVVFYPHTAVMHIGGESARSHGPVTSSGRQLEGMQIESELLYFRKNRGLLAVWLDVGLLTVGDAIVAMKRLVRRASLAESMRTVSRIRAVWSSFKRTNWGSRPTR
jgi:N-acetylglucosaminyl-diphospho-decaprenol L-rhamnosyltransferase